MLTAITLELQKLPASDAHFVTYRTDWRQCIRQEQCSRSITAIVLAGPGRASAIRFAVKW